ncbi:hypothetical protein N7462_004402 [Penicillium macrosclerotiorum]|uniref:uncharacterized protein n=1 Tax=Penicillium macrosclerotiorum TaxID=303699 RepID=UPI00254832A3|nr:uncharacterized protein N7462_004402 [Penicillium macrosclerotiorum]KAJ5690010.1 hypothetical protein N7462_004402 [Penicillium macrosclerotiorum]
MDDLESLELFSLVSRVTNELQNHLGINDKTLAEFVIDQHLKCNGAFPEFKKSLDEMGAEFPQSLMESVDRLVLTMHPKYKGKKATENGTSGGADGDNLMDELDALEKKSRVFKGLAVPDAEKRWEENDYLDQQTADNAQAGAMDDTFAMLEGLAGKANDDKPRATRDYHDDRKRSRSPEYDSHDRGRRHRDKYRSRSRSTHRHSKHDEYIDEFGRSIGRYGKEDGHRNGHSDHRRRRDRDDELRRPPVELDDEPILYKIYEGRVTGVKDFGAFVNLQGVKGKVDGLVHVSAMQEGARVNHPSDLVSRGQPVKVKVASIQGNRIGLSMKEVDQVTGMDLVPQKRLASGANMERLDGSSVNDRYGNLSSEVPVIEQSNGRHIKNRKRMTSPERWEIRQLIASGVASAADYPDLEEEYHATLTGEGAFEEEEDVDIEVRDEEPPFLAGQTKQSLELSPIRVVKAPDGSMNRAAMSGTNLAKERRELKQQEAQDKAAERAAEVDLNAQWQDPMVAPEDRKFASGTSKYTAAEARRSSARVEAGDHGQESVPG